MPKSYRFTTIRRSSPYEDILDIFFAIHDPTTLNRQGADIGDQYRSVIFHHNANQKETAERKIRELTAEAVWPGPVVTKIEPLDRFYPAEDYHQSFYLHNPRQPYCQAVIAPKMKKFRERYVTRLKRNHTVLSELVKPFWEGAMRLLLVQHGKALSKDVDPEQGLSPDGMSQVSRIAEVAKGYRVRVDIIRHSGKKRARQNRRTLPRRPWDRPVASRKSPESALWMTFRYFPRVCQKKAASCW